MKRETDVKKGGGRYFLTGLLIILPILITIYLFVSLFGFFDNILGRYVYPYTEATFGFKVPGLGLLVFFLLILFTGFFATNFLGRKFFLFFERFWFRFPVIKKIYPAVKQVVHFLFSRSLQGEFQKVVLFEYPRHGVYTIGFATNVTDPAIASKTGKDLINVLVPSVPSPVTGVLIMVPRRDLIYLDITIEEAMKIIVSGGVMNLRDFGNNSSTAYFEGN